MYLSCNLHTFGAKRRLERLDLLEHAAHLVIAAGTRRAVSNTWEEFTSSATSVVLYNFISQQMVMSKQLPLRWWF